jgi:hypothetical protein
MALHLVVNWDFRREIKGEHVYYDRVSDIPAVGLGGGSAAIYDGESFRTFLLAVNGQEYTIDWPDTGGRGYRNDEGQADRGMPLAVKLRYEPEWGWCVYVYMFSGNGNPHTEWLAVTGGRGL